VPFKIILCLALVLSGYPSSKADDRYALTELNTNEISEGYSNYHVIANQRVKLSAEKFAVRTELGWITSAEYERLKLCKGETRISTPLGSKAFSLMSLTDSTQTPYEEMKAQILVFQDGRPQWQFDFIGFKNFDADWIDEKIIKIVSWPRGTRVSVTELVNVETGMIIYKSAEGFYDRLEPSSSSKKNASHEN
jgi:hypothetical protein